MCIRDSTKAMLNKPNITEVLAQAAGQRFGGQARVAFQIGKPSPEDLGTGQSPFFQVPTVFSGFTRSVSYTHLAPHF